MMPKEEIIRSTCGFCYSACGVLVTVTGGKVTKVSGDPESPVNRGRLCPKGLSAVEQLYHPQRLRHPLQRTGARGSGQWRKISWDQAFDRIAEAFQKTKEQYGPQGVAFVQGAAKGLIDSYHERLANAFGSPNFATSGHVCFLPRLFAAKTTCGFYPVPDYQGSPACILVWGANLAHTRHGEHFQALKQLKKGSRLILIDPLPGAGSVKITLRDRLPPEQWAKHVGARDHLLPLFQRILPQSLVRAVLENDPYPLRNGVLIPYQFTTNRMRLPRMNRTSPNPIR